ncbi:NAD-dependent epimerase/dehydratase [Streptomyces sp. CB02613]|uniref:NAD-dependent epimerase/dehydratase family protein n=1 Tax=Streptomyces sp. CB02613 TaxID=2020328 RepID=UPI000C2809D4|nr:NAD-dependent epimerase/dehydratase family protein [Streptomyces sp. CB02613]PJN35394.1 NAD-dependent epimerase/dehydratase [Streptomyces sp. CB02613]
MSVDVIGDGFIARHVRHHLAAARIHAHATILAAGVSSTSTTGAEPFRREADLVRAAARHCRENGRLLVFLSSAAPSLYGRTGVGQEDARLAPVTPYGRHKLALEEFVAASGTAWLTLRLAAVTGPRQNPVQLLPSLVQQVRAGTVTVYRGARRDLMDVRHFLAVLEGLLRTGMRNRVVNVASGVAFPVETIVDGIEDRLGRRATRRHLDVPPESLRLSNRRMLTLVPEAAHFGFGPGYLDRILDRYAGAENPDSATTTAVETGTGSP